MEAYLEAFVNFEQNDWAWLLPMAEFAYKNAKNASTGYTPFELNCGYYSRVSYEEEEILDPRSKSKTAEKLSSELQELMIISNRTSTTHMSFRSKPTTKVSSPEATPQAIR